MILNDIPQLHRERYRRAMTGGSQADAIRSFCVMCMGWQQDEVELCTAPNCPLYPYRMTGRKSAPPVRSRPSKLKGLSGRQSDHPAPSD
jgi:hypothetical protein